MNRLIVIVAAAGLSLVWLAPAEEAITGQWMIDPTPLPDQVAEVSAVSDSTPP